jgi:hypothetical protein
MERWKRSLVALENVKDKIQREHADPKQGMVELIDALLETIRLVDEDVQDELSKLEQRLKGGGVGTGAGGDR